MDRADTVKTLFLQALDLAEDERAAFLATACAGDQTLREEVDGLLGALAQASGFLAEPRPAESPGARIANYCLIEQLGEGGFGTVWRARQVEPLEREVALKILKPGMDTAAVVRRFEHERQSLARMQHPHIAAVFDSGTSPAGRPWFAMELVDGLPITRFCAEHGLGVEERVALLGQVCLAVQHAHHKGVVHRDLKPGNILVATTDDGTPVPKVIDFGIAKALDPEATAAASWTLTQPGKPIGTLEYMAPEQAAGNADVDSRADVYSLGVVLYELLTGRRPFERGDEPAQNAHDLLQRIRSETAARPSTQVLRCDAPPLPGADRSRWSRRLRKDLDWIVGRALQKDPARRYPTPNALSEDLLRFLSGRPVEAGPPTAAYQLRCFVARHAFAVGAAAVVLVTLLAGVLVATSAIAEIRGTRVQKQRTVTALQQILLTADPTHQRGAAYTVRQLFTDVTEGLVRAFDNDPDVALALHLTVGGIHRNLGHDADAEQHLRRALALAQEATGGQGPVHERVQHEWSALLRQQGRYAEAEAVVDRLLSRHGADEAGDRAAAAANDVDRRVRRLLAKGDLRRLHGDPGATAACAHRVLALLAAGPGGAEDEGHRAAALDLLGSVASTRGDGDEAIRCYREALELRRSQYGAQSPTLTVSLINVADVHRGRGEWAEARRLAEEALAVQHRVLGERHQEIARTLSLLGDVALGEQRVDEAAALYERAHAMRCELLPEGHPERATGHLDLVRIARARGQDDVAERELRTAIAIQEEAGAVHSHAHAAALQNLGVALADSGRHEEAESFYRRALDLHLALGGDGKRAVADCLQNLALQRLALGDPAEAVQLHERALALRLRHRPGNVGDLLQSHSGIAAAALAAGDLRRAAAADAARADLLDQDPGAHPQHAPAARMRAAREYLDAGDPASATPLCERVYAFCVEQLPDHWPRGEVAGLLAECRLAAGAREDALRLAEEAVRLCEDSPAPDEKKQRARAILQRVRAEPARPGTDR